MTFSVLFREYHNHHHNKDSYTFTTILTLHSQPVMATFNQDFSMLSVASHKLRIFNVEPFGECFDFETNTRIAQMLFATSLVAIVEEDQRRRLRILNTKKKSSICELTFPTSILSVKLNRKRLIVVLLDQIFIYDISCMKLLHTIDTFPNERALCELSSTDDSILVYPSTGPTGAIVLFDALNITPLNIITAHKTELVSLGLNTNGSLVATASTKGTIIRVFNTFTGASTAEFRRGSYPALVHSIVFSLDSLFLAVNSDTSTVHIFQLAKEQNSDTEDPEQEEDLPSLSISNSSNEPTPRKTSITDTLWRNIPKNISSILEPQRDFAYIKLTEEEDRRDLLLGFNHHNVLIVNCKENTLSTYSVPSSGGECVLTVEESFGP